MIMTESPVAPHAESGDPHSEDLEALGAPFEIRRRVWLFVLLLLVSWALAGAYGWMAYDRQEPYLWAVVAVLALIGMVFVRMLLQIRTPLLVADLHGVRMLSRSGWVGFLWREMGEIAVERRRGFWRGPVVRVRGTEQQGDLVVSLGLATNVSAPRAEIELARRRNAASY